MEAMREGAHEHVANEGQTCRFSQSPNIATDADRAMRSPTLSQRTMERSHCFSGGGTCHWQPILASWCESPNILQVLQLSKLEILDLSKNKIVGVPEDIKKMTSLKFLAVARNRITRLPFALGDMTSLSKLKFDENPIEFPPPDALKPSPERSISALEAEKEKDVCQRVKRFLKAAALRERLKPTSEEEQR